MTAELGEKMTGSKFFLIPFRHFFCLLPLLLYCHGSYGQPSVLELKILQTRVFDVTPEKFLSGLREMCANYGGNGPSPLTDGPASLAIGQVRCVGMTSKYNQMSVQFEGQVEKNIGLVVRMRISRAGIPSYEKIDYDALTKEISDTIGVQDIPIKIDVKK